ncbi:hypothetical protein PN398_14635 [Romboutsia sp. 1001216sp1]|uniref:hypothetical protein n=1 Tax=Romboutsia sp. 1001216sp1 TaxID=2986997 RepID=UPI00232B9C8D|nr:hypothetical protein [Romboutsia sp. 1001216sp1]MDB8791956.1 hypothetical protein [Romboutsia sp. 1001216sp1]
MADVFNLKSTIEVDINKATSALQQVQRQAQQTDSTFSQSGNKINKGFVQNVSSGLVNVGKTMTTVGVGITTGMAGIVMACLLYTSPSPRDESRSRMPSSA